MFGFAIFLDQGLDFRSDRLLGKICGCLTVNETGIHERLIALRQRSERRDKVAVREAPAGAHALGQGETESDDQVFVLVDELLADFNRRQERLAIQFTCFARLLVPSRLLQIRAIARAVESDLALLAAALGTNAAMNGRTEALFFSYPADGTAQS